MTEPDCANERENASRDAERENIPQDAEEDKPFDGQLDSSSGGDSPRPQQITPEQRQAWGVENFKNNAAFLILVGCLGGIVFFALCEFCNSGNEDALKTTADTLKTFGLTVMGFLFSKSTSGKQ